MAFDRGELAIIACDSGRAFAERLITELNLLPGNSESPVSLVKTEEVTFCNQEVKTVIKEPVRGKDVYVVQLCDDPLSPKSINDNLMALMTAVNAAKQSDAQFVTTILPQFPYARQEKRLGREAITAKLFVDFLEASGVDRVLSLDIHAEAIGGFFQKAKFDNIKAVKTIISRFKTIERQGPIVVVSPDSGGIPRSREAAAMLHCKLATIYKQRDYSKPSTIVDSILIGNIDGSDVFVMDDMVGTGGTLIKAVELLKTNGARHIYLAASLPYFNGPAKQRLADAYAAGLFDRFIGTDAVMHGQDFIGANKWYEEMSVAPLFGQVIHRINKGVSISALLE